MQRVHATFAALYLVLGTGVMEARCLIAEHVYKQWVLKCFRRFVHSWSFSILAKSHLWWWILWERPNLKFLFHSHPGSDYLARTGKMRSCNVVVFLTYAYYWKSCVLCVDACGAAHNHACLAQSGRSGNFWVSLALVPKAEGTASQLITFRRMLCIVQI